MNSLPGLSPEIRKLVSLTAKFRIDPQEKIDVSPYVDKVMLDFDREVDFEPLRSVVRAAIDRPDKPENSDQWLASRVHATLRLTRREASNRRLWNYLNVVEFHDYVIWRFSDELNPDRPVPVDRFLGEDRQSALARLWWAAELTRNGSDYSSTERALQRSRFISTLLHLHLMHHRPTALAIAEYLETITDYQAQLMAKALNLVLRTRSLDAICPSTAPDTEAVRMWCSQRPDETLMINDLPVGPDEEPVPSHHISLIRQMFDQLALDIKLSTAKSPGKKDKDREDDSVVAAVP